MSSKDRHAERLRERLELLRSVDRQREVFGATTHEYRRLDPATEQEIAAFEAAHGVKLPHDYRLWISQVSRGGSGPFYGLWPFDDSEHDFADQWEPASLGRPFPLTAEWSTEMPVPWTDSADPHDGCLYLSHQGCGYYDFLIVTGERAGEVWTNFTAGDGPITASSDSFFAWLSSWLDDAFCQWACRAVPVIVADPEFEPHPGVDEAISIFRARCDAEEMSASDHRQLGYIHIYERDWDAALQAFERMKVALTQEPSARYHHCRSHVFRASADAASQEAELRAVLGCEDIWLRTEQDARDELKGLLFRTGRDGDAYALIAEIATDELDDLNAQHEHAWALYLQDRGDDAVHVLRVAVDSALGCDDDASRDQRVSAVFDSFVNGLAEGGDEQMAAFFQQARDRVARHSDDPK